MNSSRPTVIVVDDSPSVREFFERAASEFDIELHCFGSAADATEYLSDNTPDLVFLDIIMPDKDGLTFLQELRKSPRHERTRFVVISSKDYAQDRMTAKDLGALDFVAKPVTTQQIQSMITKHTGLEN